MRTEPGPGPWSRPASLLQPACLCRLLTHTYTHTVADSPNRFLASASEMYPERAHVSVVEKDREEGETNSVQARKPGKVILTSQGAPARRVFTVVTSVLHASICQFWIQFLSLTLFLGSGAVLFVLFIIQMFYPQCWASYFCQRKEKPMS